MKNFSTSKERDQKMVKLTYFRGAFKKEKLRNFGHVAKRGGRVSSSGKLFNEEKFGHVFRGGVKGTRPK